MYVVGTNVPGYLPDTEGQECETADDAKRALIAEILGDADGAESDDHATMLSHAAEDLNLTDVSGGYSIVIDDPARTHDLGRCYWIGVAS